MTPHSLWIDFYENINSRFDNGYLSIDEPNKAKQLPGSAIVEA